jgi:hypothetical protein
VLPDPEARGIAIEADPVAVGRDPAISGVEQIA